jgi:hypothetical protein
MIVEVPRFRLRCERCGVFSIPDLTPDVAVARGKRDGWLHLETSGRDFCPDCVEFLYPKEKETEP